MNDVLDLGPGDQTGEVVLGEATVEARIYALSVRAGVFRLTLTGAATDMDALAEVAKMAIDAPLSVTLREQA